MTSIQYEYTINGSPSSISRSDAENVGADTILYHAGFHRHRRFELFPEDEPEGNPLEIVDLTIHDSFIAVPRGEDPSANWRR